MTHEPAPPYDFVSSPTDIDEKRKYAHKEESIDTASSISIPQSVSGSARKLEIYYDNFKYRKATIFDSQQKENALYTLEMHLRKPHLILYPCGEPSTSTRANHASTHCMTSRIDVNVQGRNIDLVSNGYFKDGYTWRSPARNGERMSWKSKSAMGYFTIVCTNEQGTAVGRYSHSCWSFKKTGTFELMGERFTAPGVEMEEVLMTGLAMMYQRVTTYSATMGASAVSGSAAAAY